MSVRQRLYPGPGQVAGLVEHCHHARFVFNIGLEQRSMWTRDKHNRGTHPECGNLDATRVNTTTQMRELAQLRGELDWLASRDSRQWSTPPSVRPTATVESMVDGEEPIEIAKSARSQMTKPYSWVAFKPATGTGHDVFSDVEEAVSRANQSSRARRPPDLDPRDTDPCGDVVVPTDRQVLVRVTRGKRDERRIWLTDLVYELGAGGLSGRLVQPWDVRPPSPAIAYMFDHDPLVTYVTLSGMLSAVKASKTSATDEALRQRLLSTLQALTSGYRRSSTTTYTENSFSWFELPQPQALEAWAAILASRTADAGAIWSVSGERDIGEFNGGGYLCSYADWSETATWSDLVDRSRTAMLNIAADTDLAFARHPHETAGLFATQPPEPLIGNDLAWHFYRMAPADLGHWVVDVHGLQVLTGSHLDKTSNLADWEVKEVAPDRFLVEARALAAWYAQPDPLPDALEAGRKAFGDAIITKPLAIERLKLHAPRTNWDSYA